MIESEEKGKMTHQKKLVEKVYRKWLEKEDPNFTEIGREGGEKVAEERGSEFYKQIGGKAAKVGVVKSTESTEK